MSEAKEVIMDRAAHEPIADKIVILTGGQDEAGKEEKVVDLGSGVEGLPERAIKNADGTITLPLRCPVSVKVRDIAGKESTETYDKFTFHPMKGKDVRAVQAAKPEMLNIVAFSRATGINQAVMDAIFDDMLIPDINDGGRIMAFFMGDGK